MDGPPHDMDPRARGRDALVRSQEHQWSRLDRQPEVVAPGHGIATGTLVKGRVSNVALKPTALLLGKRLARCARLPHLVMERRGLTPAR